MDFKLVSKNNMGAVSTLILVILLSQARFFDFLMDTALGRAVLILFILGISYTNKILGVVAVLFIIIIFNQSNLGYMEGFTDVSGNSVTVPNAPEIQQKKNEIKQNVQQNQTTSKESFGGREGFNIIDREGTILRGKRSSEIPVLSNARTQNDDIEPTDTSIFSSAFSAL